ncbi:S8 family serine peptidase [Candidatus Solirubrobacter pratensis]|uniref:S8 family serine peptidase n=1 Tax=Candidatus Solirubrobacter pratensis TaxID=1298857 RepID=UPI00040AAD40|nr:S8 family serine peptidase [Candidatus Solirubrobacter pratensis]
MRSSLLAFLLLAALSAPASAQAAQGDIIVQRKSGLDRSERAGLRDRADVRLRETLPLAATELVSPQGSQAAALAALRKDPDVVYAEPDRRVHALTDDAAWGDLWALDNTGQSVNGPYDGQHYSNQTGTPDADIDAPEAWARSRGAGVTVGVVDTGVDSGNLDLAGQIDTSLGYDWVDGGAPDDANGHGTHVSGTIAALADNSIGVAGVAPDAKLAELRVLDANGGGDLSSVAAAFAYAGEHGLRIVNASLGGPDSAAVGQAIARYPNTLYIVAAGNDGADDDGSSPSYPCAYPYANVICVGASDNRDQPAIFSNFGKTSVDLFAPGVGILSTWKGPGQVYSDDSGTSMASPHVAGVAALALAADPSASTAQLRAAVLNGADHPPALAGLSATGGRLNANGAVQAAAAISAEPPAPTATPTSTPVVTPAPMATTTPFAAAKLTSISISGSLRTKTSRLHVRFALTRAASVGFTVTKRGAKKPVATWTRKSATGRNTVTLTRRLPTRRTLRPGAYRLSLRLSTSARSASFRVR